MPGQYVIDDYDGQQVKLLEKISDGWWRVEREDGSIDTIRFDESTIR